MTFVCHWHQVTDLMAPAVPSSAAGRALPSHGNSTAGAKAAVVEHRKQWLAKHRIPIMRLWCARTSVWEPGPAQPPARSHTHRHAAALPSMCFLRDI